MISTFGTPSADADSSSDCSAIRLRSRQVSCMIGSIPARSAARLPARLESRTAALWLSVMFTASTHARSSAAFLAIGAMSAPRGGPISAVMANSPRPGGTGMSSAPPAGGYRPLSGLSAMRKSLSQREAVAYGRLDALVLAR